MRLSKAQTDEFERQGYLFFPGAFSRGESDLLKQAAREVYAMQREEVWREKSGIARTAFAVHTYKEAFRRLGTHPRLIEPLADDTLLELAADKLQSA